MSLLLKGGTCGDACDRSTEVSFAVVSRRFSAKLPDEFPSCAEGVASTFSVGVEGQAEGHGCASFSSSVHTLEVEAHGLLFVFGRAAVPGKGLPRSLHICRVWGVYVTLF